MNRIQSFFKRNKRTTEQVYLERSHYEAAQARKLRNKGKENIRKGRHKLGAAQIELAQEHKRQASRYAHGVLVERAKNG